MKTGLTLGKFAPLHKGHQLLIETALGETDHLILMIYDCHDTTDIPLNVRSSWIKDLYPEIELIECRDGPLEVGDTPEIKNMQDDYILKILKDRKIDVFFSSEFYGDHVSKALNAVDRRVDPDRKQFPVSGSLIREDPFRYREYLHHRVYRDHIKNIVFLGGPSTGKTTITRKMAEEYNTVWVPEYGREYWVKYQVSRKLTLEQLVEIATGHIEREDRLIIRANKYLFTDTNALTTSLFSIYYWDKVHPDLMKIADEARQRYDVTFLCDKDIPFEDTWDRSGEVQRDVFQKITIDDLNDRDIQYTTIKGTVTERMDQIKKILNA